MGIWPETFNVEKRKNAEVVILSLKKHEAIILTSMIHEEHWLAPGCNEKKKKRMSSTILQQLNITFKFCHSKCFHKYSKYFQMLVLI